MYKPLFLNELSFSNGVGKDKYDCKKLISQLITLIAKLSGEQGAAVNHIPDIWVYKLVNDYTLSSWLSDRDTNPTERAYLRSFFDRGKKLSTSDNNEIECTLDGNQAIGLLHAYIENGLVLSALSDEKWQSSKVKACFSELEISSGNLKEYNHLLPHIAKNEHIDELKDIIFPQAHKSIKNAQDLLVYIDSLDQNIVFCSSAISQIKSLNDLKTIKDLAQKLDGINKYVERLDSTKFNINDINEDYFYIRPDTTNTLGMYGTERTFSLPDGRNILFKWHFNLAPGSSLRGYIHWCSSSKKIYIGYIGKHLRTKKFDS